MAGIADSPAPAINTAPLAAFGSETPATPALNDFMQAFRTGFITVDDLTRRTKQSAADTDNLKTSLSVNDVTRRKSDAERQLLPGQVSEAQTQQQIQQTTAPARVATASALAKDEQLRIDDYPAWVAKHSDEADVAAYTQATGSPPPKTLQVKSSEKPLEYGDWLTQVMPSVVEERNSFITQNPNATTQESDYFLENQKKALLKRYQEYKTRATDQLVAVPQGTPEYAKALKKHLQELHDKGALSNANFEAYKKGQDAKATAEGKASAVGGDPEERNKLVNDITTRINTDKAMSKVMEAHGFLNNAEGVLAKPNPTNSDDLLLLKSVVKLEDPNAVVRQSNIEAISKITPRIQKIQKMLKGLYSTEGAILTPEDRQQLRETVEMFKRGFDAETVQATSAYRKQAEANNIPPSQLFNKNILDSLARAAGSGTGTGSPAPTKLGDGTPVPVNSVWNQNGHAFKWDGFNWVPAQ